MPEQQFQPLWSKEQLKQFTSLYDGRGHLLSPDYKQKIEQHAAYYNVPYYEGEAEVMDVIAGAGKGFLEGFTASIYRPDDPPKSQAEALARKMGHLIGFAPSILAGPFGKIARVARARNLTSIARGAEKVAGTATYVKSAPMWAADKVTGLASKKATKMLTDAGFGNLDKLTGIQKTFFGGATRNVAHQAFHLGIASATGSVRDGVNATFDAFVGGATAGAVFGVVGNLTYPTLKGWFKSSDPKTLKKFETALKTIAGSAFQGLSATAHGATTPEQVYEYLLGAYFGGHAQPWTRAAAGKFRNKIFKQGIEGTKSERELHANWELTGRDVEQHPEFHKQPEEVQATLKENQRELFLGDMADTPEELLEMGPYVLKLLKDRGVFAQREPEKFTEEGFKDEGEYVAGEAVVSVKESAIKHGTYSATTGNEGDAVIARILGEYGIPTINYVPFRKKGDKVVGLDRELSEEQLHEASAAINKAAEQMTSKDKKTGERVPFDMSKMNNMQRMGIAKAYWAIKNAKSVYIISQMAGHKRMVADVNNKWAERIAKDMGKDVYVMDMAEGKWLKWTPNLNRYRYIPGDNLPPKPPKGMAVLARNDVAKYNKIVQPAMRKFLGAYNKIQPISDVIASRAKQAEQNKANKLKDLISKRETLEFALEEAIKEGNEIAIENLNKNIEVNREAIKALEGAAVEEVIENAVQEELKETKSEVDSQIDFEGADTRKIGKKALQFVTSHLEKVWTAGHDTPFAQREARIELTNELDFLLKEKGEKGSFENKSEELITDINDLLTVKYDVKAEDLLGDNAKGEIRQWLSRYNLGKRVIHLRSDGKIVMRMTDDANPVTIAGTRKMQEEPELMIERVAKAAGLDANDIPLMMLDHVSTTAKDGRLYDLDLSKMRDSNPKQYKAMIKNAHEFADKNDMYIFGGASDKDRLYFVKYHPQLDKLSMADVIKTKAIPAKDLRSSRTQSDLPTEQHDKMYMSNLLYDLSLNGLDINAANLKKMLTEPGFISGSAGHNKRAQIWFTNAYPGDATFVKANYDALNKNGKYNVIIVKDLAKELSDYGLKSLENIENPEHVDGAIIIPDRLLDVINKDAGVPESGQNKSFIISPNAEHGALLGKFMFHAAGPELSKQMEAKGLHMIMQESAVKQRGTREIGDYDVVNGKLDIQAKSYEISPEDLRLSYSVYGNDHFFEPQRLPKQVMMNMLHQTFDKMDQDVIDASFEKIIGNRWKGEDSFNTELHNYIEAASTGKQNEASIKRLMDNIEKVGVSEIIDAMKHENVPELSEAIYQRMLKINKEHLETAMIEGEISKADYKDSMAELSDFNSITDRVIKIATEVSQEAADAGFRITADSIYNHKFVRDFRMKAVQNFIVNSATKPHLSNSGTAYMRPYDKALQANLDKVNDLLDKNNAKGINKNDGVFFLDEGHRNVDIYLEVGGKEVKRKLGSVFKMWQNAKGKNKEYLTEVLTAATVRVPMDSVSGMQILKFGGFTGRKGHGILLHSRSMRAEGGADLDGDKAFYYFGGTRGMSKDMMQEFHKNRTEFEYTDKNGQLSTKDSKTAATTKAIGKHKKGTPLRDILVMNKDGKEDIISLAESKAGQYSPAERIRISEAAVDGRNQLGPAVSNSQLMRAAYNSILGAGGTDILELNTQVKVAGKDKPMWKKFKVTIKARTDVDDITLQRDMSRAQLGLSSDPMDEIGLGNINSWKKMLWDTYFEAVEVQEAGRKGKSKYTKDIIEQLATNAKLKFSYTNSGIFGKLVDLNKALWGRDWANNRAYSMEQIFNFTKSAMDLEFIEGASNSFLPKIGSQFVGLEWSDSPFTRMNEQALLKMYADYNAFRKDKSYIRDLLDRSSDKVEQGDFIKNAMEYKTYDIKARVKLAGNLKEFFESIEGTTFGRRVEGDKLYEQSLRGNYAKRLEVLTEMNRMAEDYLINDVSDMISFRIINDIMKDGDILPERFKRIATEIERLKKSSYLMARARAKLDKIKEEYSDEASNFVDEIWNEIHNITPEELRTSKDQTRTAELDQAEVDKQIQQFRTAEKLSPKENFLFDQLMLGSQNQGSALKKIKKFEKGVKNWDAIPLDYIKHLRWLNSKTSISRLGFSSMSINDGSIKFFLRNYMETMNNNHRDLTTTEVESLNKELNDAVSPTSAIPEVLQKRATNTGFEGVGEVTDIKSPELSSLATEVVDLLRQHPDIVGDGTGKSFNQFLRGLDLTRKDFNAMNIDDFRTLRNWLRLTKEGTIWQRIKRFFSDDAGKALSWRNWQQLPRTVNRELMATEIKLLKKEGFFTDKKGLLQRGSVKVPTQFMERLSNSVSHMIESGVGMGDDLVKQFQEGQLFYQGLTEAPALWEIAVTKREVEGSNEYLANSKKYGKDMKQADGNVKYLSKRHREAKEAHSWDAVLKHQKFYVNLDGKRVELTGREIVKRINDTLTDFMETSHNIISGREGAMEMYRIGWYDPLEKRSPKYAHDRFLKDLDNYLNGRVPARWKKFMKSANESIPSIFGIDGVRSMMREMYVDYMMRIAKKTNNKDYAKKAAKLAAFPVKSTGQLNYKHYFPRMFFDRSVVKQTLRDAEAKVYNNPELSPESKIEELVKIQQRYKRLDGDYHFEEEYDDVTYDALMEKLAAKEKVSDQEIEKWFDNDVTMGNMRTREHSTPGWSIAPTSIEAYARSLGNTYFRGLASMLTRDIISNPDTGIYNQLVKKWGPDQATAWTQFAKLFANDAIGNPVGVTQKMIDNPNMALKNSPYGWWADNRVADRMNRMAKKLGLGKMSKDVYMPKVDVHTLRKWSQMEARYEMASLLAHPKSAMANILGGTLHNVQSAGIDAVRKVYDYEYLQQIDPALKTRKDVEDMVVKHGVLPQWLIYEMGLQNEFQTNQGKEALKVISEAIKRNPDVTASDIKGILREKIGNVSDKINSVAAKFMTIPERRLRTDAFMSHYIQAWNKFGGAIQDPHHPFLIELGKKGVSATQFMYSAPHRPAFARTALGKVFTRFQMYAWNSLALRGDVMRRVKAVGYDPNSQAGKQASRFVMGDMFMLALANTFAYSIFENNLPQPWGWFQDTSEWIFGDEKERDKAFFGAYPTAVAPLQVITPAIMRGPLSVFNSVMYDDWSRFADYYVYTLFPFGRFGRDVFGPGGITEAPIRAIDKLTGLPMLKLQRMVSKDDEYYHTTRPRGILGGYE